MIKKITLNKIYLLIVFTCLFIFEYYGMMGMNMEDDVRVYTVIPNFLLCTVFMVYAFLHGNDLLHLPSVIKRFVLMYFALFFFSLILNFSSSMAGVSFNINRLYRCFIFFLVRPLSALATVLESRYLFSSFPIVGRCEPCAPKALFSPLIVAAGSDR